MSYSRGEVRETMRIIIVKWGAPRNRDKALAEVKQFWQALRGVRKIEYVYTLIEIAFDEVWRNRFRERGPRSEKSVDPTSRKIINMLSDQFVADPNFKVLDYIVPVFDKKLRDCTGAECKYLGGVFSDLSDMVGPTRKVGNVLTEDEARTVFINQ